MVCKSIHSPWWIYYFPALQPLIRARAASSDGPIVPEGVIIILCTLFAFLGAFLCTKILPCASGLVQHYVLVELRQNGSVVPPTNLLNTRAIGLSFAWADEIQYTPSSCPDAQKSPGRHGARSTGSRSFCVEDANWCHFACFHTSHMIELLLQI